MTIETVLKWLFDQILGPAGGAAAISAFVGAWLTLKHLAPRIYAPKIEALQSMIALHEARIQGLEQELEPFRKFMKEQALDAMKPRRVE